jgi:carbamoyl-phosphate synthase large subunit
MKRLLITGAGGSASYNFIKSLRDNPVKEKIYLVGTDVSKYHLELAQVDKRYVVPSINDKNYLKKINEIIDKEKIDFLHIQPDSELRFISQNRKKIHTATFLPKHKTIEICQDKMKTNKILDSNNISVPKAFLLREEKDLNSALRELLKDNDRVWLRATRGAGSKAALPVKNIKQAKSWINYWQEMKDIGFGEFMVSEFLPGKEYAFQSLWKDGKLLVSQARERIEYVFGNLTPSGQSSSPSVAKTVNNDQVNELAYSAIKTIDPKADGVFCVDLKTDKNGIIKLIEINAGRFFTTSYFFSAAGLNMPYYYFQLGCGEKIINKFKQFNNLESDIYWVRMIDMGYKLIKKEKWTSSKI